MKTNKVLQFVKQEDDEKIIEDLGTYTKTITQEQKDVLKEMIDAIHRTFYEDLKGSLEEAIAHKQGKLELKSEMIDIGEKD